MSATDDNALSTRPDDQWKRDWTGREGEADANGAAPDDAVDDVDPAAVAVESFTRVEPGDQKTHRRKPKRSTARKRAREQAARERLTAAKSPDSTSSSTDEPDLESSSEPDGAPDFSPGIESNTDHVDSDVDSDVDDVDHAGLAALVAEHEPASPDGSLDDEPSRQLDLDLGMEPADATKFVGPEAVDDRTLSNATEQDLVAPTQDAVPTAVEDERGSGERFADAEVAFEAFQVDADRSDHGEALTDASQDDVVAEPDPVPSLPNSPGLATTKAEQEVTIDTPTDHTESPDGDVPVIDGESFYVAPEADDYGEFETDDTDYGGDDLVIAMVDEPGSANGYANGAPTARYDAASVNGFVTRPQELDPRAFDSYQTVDDEPFGEYSSSDIAMATTEQSVAAKRGRPRVRRVTRVVRHIDPWSTFKIGLFFSLILYIVMLSSGVMLWKVAERTGTLANIQRWFTQFGWETFDLDGGAIFHNAWILGLFGVIALTGTFVLLVTIFNLVSDAVGGIRVTVLEEEVIESTRRSQRNRQSRHASTMVPTDQDWSVDV